LLKKVQLVLAVHCHQPVGNFDPVFEQALENCYAPFLEVLGRHPDIGMGLHYSGPLLEWVEANHPEFLDQLGKLVAAGSTSPCSRSCRNPTPLDSWR
jgi:alpha-amylase